MKEKILKAQQQVQLLNDRQQMYFENLLTELNIDAESVDAGWIFDAVFNGADVDIVINNIETVEERRDYSKQN